MIYDSLHPRFSGDNRPQEESFIADWSPDGSNVDRFLTDFINNYMDTNEKDTWNDLVNHLNDSLPTSVPESQPNNQFLKSIDTPMGYGGLKLNHQEIMDVSYNPMASHGVIPMVSSCFNNCNPSMNMGFTGYNSVSINMSNPHCFGGSSIKNVTSTNMFNNGMSANQAFNGIDRTVTPGSLSHSLAHSLAQNFHQPKPCHQISYNMGFPLSANYVQPNFQNNQTSYCGALLQAWVDMQIPQRWWMRQSIKDQLNGFKIQQRNSWDPVQSQTLVESSSHSCNGLSCNICGPARKRKYLFNESWSGTGDVMESRKRVYQSSNNYESLVGSGTLMDVLANSCMPVDLPPLKQWPNNSEDGSGPDALQNGLDGKDVSSQPGPNETSGTLMDVYNSFIKSSASTKDARPRIEDARPNSGEEKLICGFNSALDDYESILESMQCMEPCVLESEKTSTPIAPVDHKGSVVEPTNVKKPGVYLDDFFEDNGSGSGSMDIQKLSASLADFLTASQIKEHLSSFMQHEKDITGRTTSSESQNPCQLCSKNKVLLAPTPVYCSSCDLRIKQNAKYYRSTDENTKPQHCICMGCFRGSRGSTIITRGSSVLKAMLHMAKNDEEVEDSWVQCDTCQQWQHRICGLYNNETDLEGKAEYVCPKCCSKEIENGTRISLQKPVVEAKDLPRTNLSDHIEQRLSTRMKQEREETAKFIGRASEKVPVAEGLVVRVVVSVDKELEVKKQFRDIFNGQDYPEKIEYRSKEIGGVDVCLFGMYVQEFGSECNGPNNRCVYISYIDSVKYFQPERKTASGEPLRTFVYHEILIGYLEHCKKRGFASCYIWSCPLIKGEDYIFYCHPKTQKTPEKTKLRQWYKLMIKKAAKDGIVVDQTNLYNEFFTPSNTKISAARLPYFDGDCWSDAAVNISNKLVDEETSGGKLCIKSRAKRILMTNVQETLTKDALVMQNLGEIILRDKEDYMIVRLHHVCTSCNEVILSGSRWFCNQCNKIQLCSRCVSSEKTHKCSSCKDKDKPLSEYVVKYVPVDTKDNDDALVNKLFETRDGFLNKCQNSLYQFDTLGHAKYSSMMILYYFKHNLVVQPKVDTCLTCKTTPPSTEVTSEPRKEQPQDQNQETLKRALDALTHASQCKSEDGCNPDCRTVKMLLQHVNICTTRKHNGCPNCRGAWWILENHVNTCTVPDCTIPYCKYIREKRANTCQ